MMKGQALDDSERDAVAEKLARFTGLSKQYVLDSKLRIGMERYLGIFVEDTPILGGLANCSWSVIELRNGRRRLQEYNAGSLPDPVVIGDDQ